MPCRLHPSKWGAVVAGSALASEEVRQSCWQQAVGVAAKMTYAVPKISQGGWVLINEVRSRTKLLHAAIFADNRGGYHERIGSGGAQYPLTLPAQSLGSL